MYDVLIKNGTVFDGSGQESFHSSLAIKNGKIVKIGNDIKDKEARLVIDAKEKNVTPGFIDLNTNNSNPKNSDLIEKGITTSISGLYGSSAAPITKNISNNNISWNYINEYLNYLNKLKPTINFGTLIGWKTIRENVVGPYFKPLNQKELESCIFLLKESLTQGGLGVSFGLSYPEQKVIGIKEMLEAAKLVKKHNGLVAIQLRNESEEILEAIAEVIEVAKKSQANIEITNLRCLSEENWPSFLEVLSKIQESNTNFHTNIHFDLNSSESIIEPIYFFLPPWLTIGDEYALRRNLEDKAIHKNLLKILKEKRKFYEKLIFRLPNYDFMFDGKTLKEISKKFDLSVEETLIKILFLRPNNLLVEGSLISKDNIQAALKSTYSITSVPEFNLPQAQSIHKCTGLPAHKLNLKTKGIIKLNNDADIVIWSKDSIESVIINGILVFHKNQLLNTNSGKILNI